MDHILNVYAVEEEGNEKCLHLAQEVMYFHRHNSDGVNRTLWKFPHGIEHITGDTFSHAIILLLCSGHNDLLKTTWKCVISLLLSYPGSF